MAATWSHPLSWTGLRAGGTLDLVADADVRSRVAKLFDLQALTSLSARVSFRPWLDGGEIEGEVRGEAERLCGVTLQPLRESVADTFRIRVVPEGSANAPSAEREIEIDAEADDPPDEVSGDPDVGGYVVEAFGLALDPFPRAEGATFIPDKTDERLRPFAVLKSLTANDG